MLILFNSFSIIEGLTSFALVGKTRGDVFVKDIPFIHQKNKKKREKILNFLIENNVYYTCIIPYSTKISQE